MNRRDFIRNAIAAACVFALPVRADAHLSRFRNLARMRSSDHCCVILFAMDDDDVFMSTRDNFSIPTFENTRIFQMGGFAPTEFDGVPSDFDALLDRAPLIGVVDTWVDVFGMYADFYPEAKPFYDAETARFREFLYGNKRRISQ